MKRAANKVKITELAKKLAYTVLHIPTKFCVTSKIPSLRKKKGKYTLIHNTLLKENVW